MPLSWLVHPPGEAVNAILPRCGNERAQVEPVIFPARQGFDRREHPAICPVEPSAYCGPHG